jgi:hypothetical protein
MRHALLLAALLAVTGCSTISDSILPPGTSTPAKAAAITAETIGTLRVWEILGYIK